MLLPSNPKLEGSGIIDAIPQCGPCPNNCPECFYNREEFFTDKTRPYLPTVDEVGDRIVRMNYPILKSWGFLALSHIEIFDPYLLLYSKNTRTEAQISPGLTSLGPLGSSDLKTEYVNFFSLGFPVIH